VFFASSGLLRYTRDRRPGTEDRGLGTETLGFVFNPSPVFGHQSILWGMSRREEGGFCVNKYEAPRIRGS